jgi:hypothetical protein
MQRQNCYTCQDICHEGYKFGSTKSWIPIRTEKCSDQLMLTSGRINVVKTEVKHWISSSHANVVSGRFPIPFWTSCLSPAAICCEGILGTKSEVDWRTEQHHRTSSHLHRGLPAHSGCKQNTSLKTSWTMTWPYLTTVCIIHNLQISYSLHLVLITVCHTHKESVTTTSCHLGNPLMSWVMTEFLSSYELYKVQIIVHAHYSDNHCCSLSWLYCLCVCTQLSGLC